MALGHALIERTLDTLAETIALMGVLGNHPVSLQGIGAYLERRVTVHLSRLGLTENQIAAFFEHRSTKTTRAWLNEEAGLQSGEIQLIVSRVESEPGVREQDVIHDFVTADRDALTDDLARRRRRRALDILSFLQLAGTIDVSGPRGRRTFTAVPVPPQRGLDSTIWLWVHRHGPASLDEIATAMREPKPDVAASLQRLTSDGVVDHAEAGWSTRRVVQPDSPEDWHASVIDHLEAVMGTVSARLRYYLPPGLRSEPPSGTGFDTVQFSLSGRDAQELAGVAIEFRERLKSLIRDNTGRPILRVYLGQSFIVEDE